MEILKDFIKKVEQDQDVVAVMLFGSYALGKERADSDVDVCLVLRPETFDPLKAFDKKVNLSDDARIDVQIYQSVPLYIRQRILQDGKILFCRDEEALYEIACKTITEFSDYEHIYVDYMKEVERG